MESGWRPNSVKVGDKWVSYSLFQPASVQAAVIANAFEAWQAAGAKQQDAPSIAAAVMARSLDSFLDQSFLAGLFDLVQAVSRGDINTESGERLIGRMAHSFTTLAGVARMAGSGAGFARVDAWMTNEGVKRDRTTPAFEGTRAAPATAMARPTRPWPVAASTKASRWPGRRRSPRARRRCARSPARSRNTPAARARTRSRRCSTPAAPPAPARARCSRTATCS